MAISNDKRNKLLDLLNSEKFSGSFKTDEKLSGYTSYKIGGPAAFFVVCESGKDVKLVAQFCNSHAIDWAVLGGGSNVLVSDKGYDGVVVSLGKSFKTFDFDSSTGIYNVGGSTKFSSIVNDAYNKGLTGLEFAKGIPGSVGGAVFMNAGTVSDWICNRIKRIKILTPECKVEWVPVEAISWSYRASSLTHEHVVLAVELACKQLEDEESINQMRTAMDESMARRKKTQPQGVGTCGSVFRNPDGDSAGRMIEECGLKGYKLGGARISPVHANFIVNDGDACSRDVISIIKLAQNRVYDKFGVKLKPEVKFLGYSNYPVLL